MSRLMINFTAVLLCAIFQTFCGFIDLRQIGFSVEPDSMDSLLNGSYSPVIVRFDTEMEKSDAEKILQITSDMGVMKGDIVWKDNDLYFVPISGWTAGIRYTASLTGTIRSVDGRELRLHRFITFYAVNKDEPPLLEWHYPAAGASVGTGDIFLEFHFSRSMDRLTAESSLAIEGIGNKTFEWSDNGKILKVSGDKTFTPWVTYRWNLRDSAKSADGVPLPKTYSGYFTTNLDQILPQVTGVFPVLHSNGCWYPTGAGIKTGLGSGQGIAVEFNKPMGETVLRSMRFEPALTGRTELLSEKGIVYIFTKDPEPETEYALIISSETKDSEGLKIGTDYRINFVPDIPFLNVLSFTADANFSTENLSSNMTIPVKIISGTGELSFSIGFSLGFTTEEKQNTAQKIMLTSFFPRTLSPIALQYVKWFSDDRIYMRWEGLSTGAKEAPNYYKLLIPGGRNGVISGTGMFMKEDLIIYLEAVSEN
jgi:hypothetical protein